MFEDGYYKFEMIRLNERSLVSRMVESRQTDAGQDHVRLHAALAMNKTFETSFLNNSDDSDLLTQIKNEEEEED